MFETFIYKTFWKTAIALAGGLAPLVAHDLCVFLCSPLFDAPWELYKVNFVKEKCHPPTVFGHNSSPQSWRGARIGGNDSHKPAGATKFLMWVLAVKKKSLPELPRTSRSPGKRLNPMFRNSYFTTEIRTNSLLSLLIPLKGPIRWEDFFYRLP